MNETATNLPRAGLRAPQTLPQQKTLLCLARRSFARPRSGSTAVDGAAGIGDERICDVVHHTAQGARGDHDDGDATHSGPDRRLTLQADLEASRICPDRPCSSSLAPHVGVKTP